MGRGDSWLSPLDCLIIAHRNGFIPCSEFMKSSLVILQQIQPFVWIFWAALRKKVPKGLSCGHTKRRMSACGRANHYLGMTPTFGGEKFPPKKKRKKQKERKKRKEKKRKKLKKKKSNNSVSYKRRTGMAERAQPSFGMTTTRDIRDLFARRRSNDFWMILRQIQPFVWILWDIMGYSVGLEGGIIGLNDS